MNVEQKKNHIESNYPDISIYNIISHELKAPIHSIAMLTELLEEKIDSLPEETIMDMLSKVKASAKNLASIAEYLGNMTTVPGDDLVMSFACHNLKDVLREVAKTCSSFTGLEPKTSVYFGCEKGEYECLIDVFWFKQLLINLVINAIKYTEKGSVFLHLESYIEEETTFFKITCMDEGIGVEETNLDKIFNPFVVIPTNSDTIENGQGLGLAIAKKITNMHGAHIKAKRNSDKGTRIEIIMRKEAPITSKELSRKVELA